MSAADTFKRIVSDNDTVLWAVTFAGVCVLVGLGKMDSKTVEYMMMAIVGRASLGRKPSETPVAPDLVPLAVPPVLPTEEKK